MTEIKISPDEKVRDPGFRMWFERGHRGNFLYGASVTGETVYQAFSNLKNALELMKTLFSGEQEKETK